MADPSGQPADQAQGYAGAPTGQLSDHSQGYSAAPSGQWADRAQGYVGASTGQPFDHSQDDRAASTDPPGDGFEGHPGAADGPQGDRFQGYSAASKRQPEDDSRRYEDSAPTTGLFSDGSGGYGSREGDEGSERVRGLVNGDARVGGAVGGGARRGSSRRRSGGPDGPDEGSGGASGPPANPESVARAICLRLLTMGPKTRAQLAEALRKREVPDEGRRRRTRSVHGVGSDSTTRRSPRRGWTHGTTGEGWPGERWRPSCGTGGVDSDTVNEAVERVDSDQEADTARRLVERKLASTRGLDAQVRTRRLAGMLARKGYGAGLAYRGGSRGAGERRRRNRGRLPVKTGMTLSGSSPCTCPSGVS
ncbi:hypothetical protein GCM10020219_022690 [Nonomuraea dietziae]